MFDVWFNVKLSILQLKLAMWGRWETGPDVCSVHAHSNIDLYTEGNALKLLCQICKEHMIEELVVWLYNGLKINDLVMKGRKSFFKLHQLRPFITGTS